MPSRSKEQFVRPRAEERRRSLPHRAFHYEAYPLKSGAYWAIGVLLTETSTPSPRCSAIRPKNPSNAVDQNSDGTTYFVFGGAHHRPFYSGSGVIYEVVAK